MKLKAVLIITVLISATTILYGCGNSKLKETSLDENNSNKTEIASDNTNNANSSKSEITPDSTNNATKSNSESKKDTNTSTNSNNSLKPKNSKTINDSNVTQKSNQSTNDLIFKSKLGFSMQFPSSWKGKYKIKEDNESLAVYFKSKDPKTPENRGLLFVIKKKYDSGEEEMFDSIAGKKFITVGNTTYLIGGSTDVSLDSTTTDINEFLSMNRECGKVIDTIKSIN